MSLYKRDRLLKLCVGSPVGMAENDTTRVFYLVVEKLTEVLHIHFALVDVYHDGKAVQLHVLCLGIPYGADNVAQLTDTRRLDKHSVGRVFGNNVLKSAAEISHERTAYTARIHLGNIDTRVL